MGRSGRLHQGTYKLQNPKKYNGDPTNVTYRSGWELTFMRWADTNSSVLDWSSEEVVIPYRTIIDDYNDKKNGRKTPTWHKYYVDFYIKVKNRNNQVERYLVEIKPFSETKPPVITENTSKKSRVYMEKNWIVNQAKWRAAREFAADRGMKFKIMTERELYGWK